MNSQCKNAKVGDKIACREIMAGDFVMEGRQRVALSVKEAARLDKQANSPAWLTPYAQSKGLGVPQLIASIIQGAETKNYERQLKRQFAFDNRNLWMKGKL